MIKHHSHIMILDLLRLSLTTEHALGYFAASSSPFVATVIPRGAAHSRSNLYQLLFIVIYIDTYR